MTQFSTSFHLAAFENAWFRIETLDSKVWNYHHQLVHDVSQHALNDCLRAFERVSTVIFWVDHFGHQTLLGFDYTIQ